MRKLIAMAALFTWLIVYIAAIASLSGPITALPAWVQLFVYVVAGTAWILPVRPLFRWMNTPADPSV